HVVSSSPPPLRPGSAAAALATHCLPVAARHPCKWLRGMVGFPSVCWCGPRRFTVCICCHRHRRGGLDHRDLGDLPAQDQTIGEPCLTRSVLPTSSSWPRLPAMVRSKTGSLVRPSSWMLPVSSSPQSVTQPPGCIRGPP